MHQFFVDREQIGTEYITITGEDVKHIKNVLRMKEGEEVRISDGAGGDFFCTIRTALSCAAGRRRKMCRKTGKAEQDPGDPSGYEL